MSNVVGSIQELICYSNGESVVEEIKKYSDKVNEEILSDLFNFILKYLKSHQKELELIMNITKKFFFSFKFFKKIIFDFKHVNGVEYYYFMRQCLLNNLIDIKDIISCENFFPNELHPLYFQSFCYFAPELYDLDNEFFMYLYSKNSYASAKYSYVRRYIKEFPRLKENNWKDLKFLLDNGCEKGTIEYATKFDDISYYVKNDINYETKLEFCPFEISGIYFDIVTPIRAAAYFGSTSILKFLLSKNVNTSKIHQWALSGHNSEVVEVLRTNSFIELGFPYSVYNFQNSLCHYLLDNYVLDKVVIARAVLEACRSNNIEMFNLLFEKMQGRIVRGHGKETIVHAAAQSGCVSMMRLLSKYKSVTFTDIPDILGVTPLMTACKYGNTSIVKFLVLNGAKLESSSRDGKTPLLYAIESGNIELVRFLVQSGANVKCHDHEGNTPFNITSDSKILSVLTKNMDKGINNCKFC